MRFFLNIFFVLSVLAFIGCKQSDPIQKEYTLIWEDNFDGPVLDEEKWEVQEGDGSDYGLWRWGNNEEQWYKKENIKFYNGTLLIKSIKEESNGYHYTSARIRTLNKLDFKYGKVEARIRMSKTQGLWHAFWMLPSHPSKSWPVSGEIDILEYVGNNSAEIFNTIHFADAFGNHQQLGDVESVSPDDVSTNFHVYSIEWDENEIIWYMDSVETFKVLRSNQQISSTWPFDSEFHLLLNTAVGGNLGGLVDDTSMAKQKFLEVDYIKVYQKL